MIHHFKNTGQKLHVNNDKYYYEILEFQKTLYDVNYVRSQYYLIVTNIVNPT